ncbi:MAG: hypothetical protein Q4B80_00530 [Aerococcaceae bacterium]|nr:hypothetical protein [Aerococcaceae bacterium]
MTKKRKKVIYFLIVITIFLIWRAAHSHQMAVRDNLRTYALYYAQHIPTQFTQGRDISLEILLRDGKYIPTPWSEKAAYRFEDDWEPTTEIIIELEEGRRLRLSIPEFGEDAKSRAQLSETHDDKYIYIYEIDVSTSKVIAFKQIDSKNFKDIDTTLTDERRKEGEDLLSQIIQPIIDYQKEPEWNLQQLFNMNYPQH